MSDVMLSWVHIGDLHIDEDDGFESLRRFEAIVAEIEQHIGADADFVFLPGDNANHGTPEQYARLLAAIAPLSRPYYLIPGDHDFEPGDLAAYEAAFEPANRPEVLALKGHRLIFLDIVSAGLGGPDFRLSMHHRNRLAEELAQAEANCETPLVFMHAYPGDLAADGDTVAQALADGRVAYVDTGHTHYNELLNDDRVLYGAVRSTGQIEEGAGLPGYAVVTVRDRVVSWCFRETGADWPLVQIVAPADRRLVARPADPRQVPRPTPHEIEIVARLFGYRSGDVMMSIDGAAGIAMTRDGPVWSATTALDAGLHRVRVTNDGQEDEIEILVRPQDGTPKRRAPIALGRDVHSIGAWRTRGIDGAQRGPNKNGQGW